MPGSRSPPAGKPLSPCPRRGCPAAVQGAGEATVIGFGVWKTGIRRIHLVVVLGFESRRPRLSRDDDDGFPGYFIFDGKLIFSPATMNSPIPR